MIFGGYKGSVDSVPGFMLVDLMIYCMVIGFLLLFLGVGAQWLVKAGNSSRLLDTKIELLSALFVLEQDVRAAYCEPSLWYVSALSSAGFAGKQFVFAINDSKSLESSKPDGSSVIAGCGWEVKNGQLRRLEGVFCAKRLSWIKRTSISVLCVGVESINCKLLLASNIVRGVKVRVKMVNGKSVIRLIKLRKSLVHE